MVSTAAEVVEVVVVVEGAQGSMGESGRGCDQQKCVPVTIQALDTGETIRQYVGISLEMITFCLDR